MSPITDLKGWFRPDPTVVRLAVWFAIAASINGVCFRFRLSFPSGRGIEIAAAGTFHYGVWRQVAERAWERINNPNWATFEAQVELDQKFRELAGAGMNLEVPTDLLERETAPAWLTWKAEAVKDMLCGLLPNSRIILTNYLRIAYLLFESSLIDLVSRLLRVETPIIGAISAGTLLATALPLSEVWVRYAGGVGNEFAAWQRDFKQAMPRPPETAGPV